MYIIIYLRIYVDVNPRVFDLNNVCCFLISGRRLRLLSCTMAEIMPFCMEVIIRTLKDVAFSDAKNDRALGQLLVLLQYQWPKEEEIFASLITAIQKRRKFIFPEFFQYIIRIPIYLIDVFSNTCVCI